MDTRLAKTNYEYCQETFLLKQNIELDYLKLGKNLAKIFAEKMYEPNYEDFDEFLKDLKISRSTASKLINIYLKFVVEFKVKPERLAEAGGWSIVSEILPLATSKNKAIIWLAKAIANKRDDLRKEIMEQKTGIIMSGCKHANTEEICFTHCLDCHDRFQSGKQLEKLKP